MEKRFFAQTQVKYLGHLLQRDGVSKNKKVDVVLSMPVAKDISFLKPFLDSVKCYSKFYFPLTQPKQNLCINLQGSKQVDWLWGPKEKAFQKLKKLLSSNQDRFFDRLERPVEESRPDRFPSLKEYLNAFNR